MTNKVQTILSVSFGLLALSCQMLAHHGTAALYDQTKRSTLTGFVTEFVWQNPHSWVYFDVKDAKGDVTHWGAELNSPGSLARTDGWTVNTVKPGDEIVITLFPSKAGSPDGVANKI